MERSPRLKNKPYRGSRYFTQKEVSCNCGREDCDALKDPPFWFFRSFELAREESGVPFPVSSWIRCKYWNEKIGGARNSFHPLGIAVDVKVSDSKARYRMIKALIANNFSVIVYSTWIHADRRPGGQIFLRGRK